MKRVSLDQRLKQKSNPLDTVFEPTEKPKPTLKKLTAYILPEHYIALEEIQLSELKKTGKKPDKLDLFQEAIELLIEKYNKKN
ncbi:MAG: hypothetical protein FD167_1268 [bacterium]|nr:MAG: hypothetical protein FD167_1268 [bacterium]